MRAEDRGGGGGAQFWSGGGGGGGGGGGRVLILVIGDNVMIMSPWKATYHQENQVSSDVLASVQEGPDSSG